MQKMPTSRGVILGIAFWSSVGLMGCGTKSPAVSINGQVIFQGKIVPHGHISFNPLGKDYKSEPRVLCGIRNGEYVIPPGQWVRAGEEYRVEVGGFPKKQESEEERVEPLFQIWSQNIVVPEGGGTLDISIPK